MENNQDLSEEKSVLSLTRDKRWNVKPDSDSRAATRLR